MRAAVSVLGAGELGKACAFALAANGLPAVDLLTRDVALAQEDREGATVSGGRMVSSTSATVPSTTWPAAIHLRAAAHGGRDGRAAAFPPLPLFVCTPATSYLAPDDAWAKAALGHEHAPVTHTVLQQQCSVAARQAAIADASQPPFVSVFTRGFTADGAVPAQLADALLNETVAASGADCIPVLVAAGPIVAKEWAQQSTPVPSDRDGNVHAGTSSIPPRPKSALGGEGEGHQANTDKPRGRSIASPSSSSATAASLPHAYSGVALSFATWTPSLHADAGRQAALAQQFKDLFPRESVTFLSEPDAAAVLAIVNGCVPLCAFGAGLVSHVYTGTSVTSLAAYAQHAAHATEQLVNALLGRPAGTPLPLAAWSTLHCACTCFASREFALGRQLEFYFRKQDAAEAIFRGRTHQVFAATVDGLHTRMQQCGVSQPFFEVLMDTYNTMIRASRAGEGLVKDGDYGYRDCAATEDSLLHHAQQVDEAMLSGDDDQFTAAKERIMRAFPDAVIR